MIIRARLVVTMDGDPIDDGAVVISQDRIVDVGRVADIKQRNSGEVIDLGECALLPGLINAHCHLDYTCVRGRIPRPQSFTDWVRAINAVKETLSANDYVRAINEGFAEAKRFGTTTIANLTAFPELIARVQPPIRTWWFAELIDVRNPAHAAARVHEAVAFLRPNPHWGLAPHAPFTASPGLFRNCEQAADLLTTHLAESKDEMTMFRDATGPLFDFLCEIGRDMSDCGRSTPVARFLDEAAVTVGKKWILTHLNEVTDNDFELLTRCVSEFSVVHCPRSHAYFGHSPFSYHRLLGLGLNICLGTDSLASNDDLSLFAEMRAFQKRFPQVEAKEILGMVTINPARALGQQDELGQVRPNHVADLIAVPFAGQREDVFDAVIGFAEPVPWAMIGGDAAIA